MTKVSIAVLCGGNSSRFGSDKTRVKFGEVPLYVRTWNKLQPKSDDIFLQAAPDDEYDLPTNPDLIEGGSLGGIYSALTHSSHEWLFVSACDLPLLDPDLVDELYAEVQNDTLAVIPKWQNGYLEPLAALYHRSVLPTLEGLLEEGTRKITDFLDSLKGVKKVSIEHLQEEKKISRGCFYNVNTKKDLEKIDTD